MSPDLYSWNVELIITKEFTVYVYMWVSCENMREMELPAPTGPSQLIQVECGGGRMRSLAPKRFEFCVETSITF